jgi:hypothetical protein
MERDHSFSVFSPALTYSSPTMAPCMMKIVQEVKTTIPNLLPGVTYTYCLRRAGTGCYYFETACYSNEF